MRDPAVDIVVNLTTPNAHFEVSDAALTAGKHVFSEKPLCVSADVWRHGHPPIELYRTEGSLPVPDPNFFGGSAEVTVRGEDWQLLDSSSRLYGKPSWRSPNWPAKAPDRANYRCLGIADLANSVLNGTPHRSTRAFAAHVLEVTYALLQAGADGGTVKIASRIERPRPCRMTKRRFIGAATSPEPEGVRCRPRFNRPP